MAGAKRAAKKDTATQSSSGKKAKVAAEAASSKITVTLDPKLLECCVGLRPLVPPVFQVQKYVLINHPFVVPSKKEKTSLC